MFSLARFSEAFLILRARDAGLPIAYAPGVLILMNAVYAAGAAPLGSLGDRIDRRLLLAAGLAVLIAADLALALAPSLAGVVVGIALWGLHMALTQGLFSALIADAAPERLSGSAFGVYNRATGVAVLAASRLAGGLWSMYGARATFIAGAGFAIMAMAMLWGAMSRRAA